MIKIKDFFQNTVLKVTLVALLSACIGASTMAAFSTVGEQVPPSPPSADNSKNYLKLEMLEFTGLSIMIDVSVTVVEGEYPGYIEVEDTKYGTDAISTIWTDDQLTIIPGKGGRPDIRITSDLLESVSVYGKATLDMTGKLEGNDIKLVGAGLATMNINKIATPNLAISMMGKASLNIKSVDANSIGISALGSSDVTMGNIVGDRVNMLVSDDASVDVAGVCRKKSMTYLSGGTINAKGLIEDSNKLASLPGLSFDSVPIPADKYFHLSDSLKFFDVEPGWLEMTKKFKDMTKSFDKKRKKAPPVTQP